MECMIHNVNNLIRFMQPAGDDLFLLYLSTYDGNYRYTNNILRLINYTNSEIVMNYPTCIIYPNFYLLFTRIKLHN